MFNIKLKMDTVKHDILAFLDSKFEKLDKKQKKKKKHKEAQ